MKVFKDNDIDSIFKKAFDQFKIEVTERLKEREIVTVGVPGGNSAKKLFELFKNDNYLPWSKIHFFMLDERCVPITHKDSNFKLLNELFGKHHIKKGLLKIDNFHPVVNGADEYTKELHKYSDRLDILIVGAGPDSHFASLFPRHDSIKDESTGFIEVYGSPKPPPRRVSVSKKLAQKANSAFLFFVGVEKRVAFEKFSNSDLSEIDCPIQTLKNIEKLFIYTDL